MSGIFSKLGKKLDAAAEIAAEKAKELKETAAESFASNENQYQFFDVSGKTYGPASAEDLLESIIDAQKAEGNDVQGYFKKVA